MMLRAYKPHVSPTKPCGQVHTTHSIRRHKKKILTTNKCSNSKRGVRLCVWNINNRLPRDLFISYLRQSDNTAPVTKAAPVVAN